MKTFYSTLAQVTTMFLGVVLAVCAAYFVFLQERQSHFLDEIYQNRIAAAETLQDTIPTWPLNAAGPIAGLTEEYGSTHRELGRAALIAQAATDLVFRAPELESAARRVCKRGHVPEDRWRGLTYLWILGEALFLLTGNPGDDSFAGVFPQAALGPGYDSWKAETFDKLIGPIQLLESFASESSLADYVAFSRAFSSYPQDYLSQVKNSRLTPTIQKVRKNVNAIELADLQRQMHSFENNTRVVRLFFLMTASFLAGRSCQEVCK